jgi:iron complex outermembrane recepter protein
MDHFGSTARSARSHKQVRARCRLLIATSTALYLCFATAAAPTARAQTEVTNFNVPAQSLRSALLAYSAQSKVQVAIPDELVEGKNAPAVSGALSNEQALKALLAGSGIQVEFIDARAARLTTAQHDSAAKAGSLSPVSTGRAVQSAQQLQLAQPPEEIVVTGTRIRGSGPVGSESITLTRDQILQTGKSTTAELIRTIPQNSSQGAGEAVRLNVGQSIVNFGAGTPANLRGLGPDATLILLNGHRMAPAGRGAFVDISQIPINALERVEIVVDGASALYGSDAIGGVINFILKRNYQGAEANVRYDAADGFHRWIASGSVGTKWTTGSALLSYEYFRQTNLDASNRDYYSQDLRRFGGPDLRSTNGSPGTISASGTTYAIPTTANGRITASQLVAGTANRLDQYLDTDIVPAQRRHSVVLSASQDVSDRLRIFADGLYSSRQFENHTLAQVATLSVPSTNPFFVSPVAGARTVSVLYSFLNDNGPQSSHGVATDIATTIGAEWKFTSDWRVTVEGSFARDHVADKTDNVTNTFLLNAALADANPLTAFNPFGAGGISNPATLAAARGFARDAHQGYLVRSLDAAADGSLFVLPGGAIRLAVGGEYRTERLKDYNIAFLSTATPTAGAIERGNRRSTAGFAELFVPIVDKPNAVDGVRHLELTAALRYDHYSDFGSSTDPKLGVRWSPTDDLGLRATWGTSFKAPYLQQLYSNQAYSTLTVADPRSPTGQSPVVILGGGNTDLKPETATTWSAGFDYAPSWLPRAKLSATYFAVDYTDKVSTLGTATTTALTQETLYSSVVTRSPSAAAVNAIYDSPFFQSNLSTKFPVAQIAAIIDARFKNVASVKQEGVDVTAQYELDALGSSWTPSLNVAYLSKYKLRRTPADQSTSFLNTYGNPIRLRVRGGVTWRAENLSASTFVNRVGGYSNTSVTPSAQVDAWTTADAQFSIETRAFTNMLGDGQVTIGIQNVLDQKPPYMTNTLLRFGYDPESANPFGRIISLSYSQRW